MSESTGYFASSGREGRTKVHLVEGEKPICGAVVRGTFLFCANRVRLNMVECAKCKAKYARLQDEGPRPC
jgi:hypothetical protein